MKDNKDQISIKARLIIFSTVLILLISVFAGTVYVGAANLNDINTILINHPLKVSNASTLALAKISMMHRTMKDVVLAENESDLIQYIAQVETLEAETLEQLQLVKDNILGDEGRQKADKAIEAFQGWRMVRERVLNFVALGMIESARDVTQHQGASYVQNLELIMEDLNRYAMEKSQLFSDQSRQSLERIQEIVVIGISLLLLFAGVFSYLMGRNILSSIRRFADEIQGIISGREYRKIGTGYAREIEQLAHRFNELITTVNKHLWIKNGQGMLQGKLVDLTSRNTIAEHSVTAIAEYINASFGAIYLFDSDGEFIVKNAAYADIQKRERFLLGEGLVGQVAKTGRPIRLDQAQLEGMKLEINEGSVSPITLFAYPIRKRDLEIIGVVEFGLTRNLTEEEIEFLNLSGAIIGVYLESIDQFSRIQNLLQDANQMNERLQIQQVELEQNAREIEENARELHETNLELEAQQDEMTRKNEELLQIKESLTENSFQLSKANNLKSEFLANMSHELRTPLNSIILLSSSLSRSGEIQTEEKKKLDVIRSASEELLALINNILDISKIESGKMEVIPEKVYTGDLVIRLKSHFDEVAREKGVELRIDDRIRGELTTDRQKLIQILTNFLSNAFKFTNSGSVSLVMENSADSHRPHCFRVTDTGIGIPEERKQGIFDAFVQGDGSITREFGGTGLGLSISKNFSEMIGAKLSVESEEGSGSTFSVHLPQMLPDRVVVEPEHLQGLSEDRSKKILLIDDDEDFIESVKPMVEDQGFRCLSAATGYAGLEMARDLKPDGIVLDLILPDINGGIVLKELKMDPETRGIPVHVLSVKDPAGQLLFKKGGAVGYTRKSQFIETDVKEALTNITRVVNKDPKMILVVEDQKEEVESIRQLVDGWEVAVDSVSTAQDAKRKMEEKPYDVVIVDLVLEEGDGFEICRHIKETKKDFPVIVYTAKDLSAGQYDRLKKISDTIVLKTANSRGNLLEEIAVFTHKIHTWDSTHEIQLPAGKKSLSGRRVLVCDDDPRNVFTLTTILEEMGLEVIDAYNGIEALDVIQREEKLDLILMDIMMPEMDGFETIRRVRRGEKGSDVPIIALTAKAMKGDRERCLSVGANDYMSKPIDMDMFIKLVELWIGGQR